MSTSFDIQKAMEFARKAKEPRLLWTITAPSKSRAIDTREISSKKWQEELLFDKEQKIKIDKVFFNKQNKVWEIKGVIL